MIFCPGDGRGRKQARVFLLAGAEEELRADAADFRRASAAAERRQQRRVDDVDGRAKEPQLQEGIHEVGNRRRYLWKGEGKDVDEYYHLFDSLKNEPDLSWL